MPVSELRGGLEAQLFLDHPEENNLSEVYYGSLPDGDEGTIRIDKRQGINSFGG